MHLFLSITLLVAVLSVMTCDFLKFSKQLLIRHIIIVPANWPAKRSAHWKALLRARAIENQVYILAINCVGDIGGVDYTGDSCIIDPEGGIRAMLSGTEGNLYYTLTDDVESFRAAFPVKLDRREQFYKGLYEKD